MSLREHALFLADALNLERAGLVDLAEWLASDPAAPAAWLEHGAPRITRPSQKVIADVYIAPRTIVRRQARAARGVARPS
jgi:hypothetical protein